MANKIKAKKLNMSQVFADDGRVIPVTWIEVLSDSELTNIKSVNVIGKSKGKGFQGVVKRYNFSGDLATHGRSDKHRAVGSIGAETHVSRVLKGKRMPGRMGNKTVNLKNRPVILIEGKKMAISGAIPGAYNSVLQVIFNLNEN